MDQDSLPAVEPGQIYELENTAIEIPENLRPWLTLHEGGRYTLKLQTPVPHGQQQVSEINGRRPRGRHMHETPLQDLKVGQWLDMFSRSTGTPSTVADELDISDVMRVVTLMVFFMGGGLPTGPT